MAYETGTASSATDLLDKFRLFAIAQGWTVNRWASWTSGYELCISKGSSYFNLRSAINATLLVNGTNDYNKYGITLNGSDGYSAGSAWDRQPGYPLLVGGSVGVDQVHALVPFVTSFGPFRSYHFFAPDSKTLYAEIEVVSGTFQRFGVGALDLFNAAAAGGGRFYYGTGGEHVTNSTDASTWLGRQISSVYSLGEVPFRSGDPILSLGRHGSAVRCAFDAFDNWAGSGVSSNYTFHGKCAQGSPAHDRVLRELSLNPLNNIGLLLPIIVSVNRANAFLQPLGVIPGIRYMDMTNYLPGDEITLGSDVWKIFPWYIKGGRSLQRGIAYLKV